MVVLPPSFFHCVECGRLNIRDGLNPNGRCECAPPPSQPDPDTLMGKLATVHACPNPDECSFGGVGCRREGS